jgi:hypothetical protein
LVDHRKTRDEKRDRKDRRECAERGSENALSEEESKEGLEFRVERPRQITEARRNESRSGHTEDKANGP